MARSGTRRDQGGQAAAEQPAHRQAACPLFVSCGARTAPYPQREIKPCCGTLLPHCCTCPSCASLSTANNSSSPGASAQVSFSSLIALPLPRPLRGGFASLPELSTHDCSPSSDCTLDNIYYCTADRKKMLYKGYHAPTFAFSCNNTAFLAPVQPTRCCSLSSVLPTSACRRSKWRK